MEPNLNDPNSPAQDEAALKWSCDVLGLNTFEQAINKKETRRAALTSFFNELKSNDFSADKNSAAAVELIHGNDAQQSPAYVRGQQRKQLRQLDALVRWFASQLGVQDHQQLRTALWRQLSQFNAEGCSEQVKNYGAKIWAAAESVASPAGETNAAAKKVLQALFHIATIRSTQRNAVRCQHVVRLKKEFSEEQLTVARNTIWHHHDTPNEIFHRPFLWLLTSDEDSVEAYEIRQPVASTAATLPYHDSDSNPTTSHTSQEGSGSNFKLFAVIIVCSLVGLFFRTASKAINNDKPAWSTSSVKKPNFKFDPTLDPDDPRSVESALRVLRTLKGEDSELPTVEEFEGIKERAEQAKRRLEEREAVLGSGSEGYNPLDEIAQQHKEQSREREHDRAEALQQKKDDAFKAMSDFLRKKETRKQKLLDETPQQEAKLGQPAPITPGGSAHHDAIQRHIDRQQEALNEARKRESSSPSAKFLNDVMQRDIDSLQKRLNEARKSELESALRPTDPSDPNKMVDDIMQKSLERHQKMVDEAKQRDAEFKQQLEEMRRRMDMRSRPNFRGRGIQDRGIQDPSNRIPRSPFDI